MALVEVYTHVPMASPYTVVLNVTPSLRTRSSNTHTSEKLGRDLLEAADEYHDRIPDGLYLKLCNLAKVQHNCVIAEEMHDACSTIYELMTCLSRQHAINDMLKDTAEKRDELIEALKGSLEQREQCIEALRRSAELATVVPGLPSGRKRPRE